MRKKLRLDVGELAVTSFRTAEAEGGTRGTVQALAACTCAQSCVCPSAVYWCADIAETVYSCDYSHNASCWTTS